MLKLPQVFARGDYILAVAESRPNMRDTYHLGRYREQPIEPRYSVTAESIEGGALIHLQAHSFVPCVKLYAGEGAAYEDNYFDMAAGEKRTVRITGGTCKPEVQTFADKWEH